MLGRNLSQSDNYGSSVPKDYYSRGTFGITNHVNLRGKGLPDFFIFINNFIKKGTTEVGEGNGREKVAFSELGHESYGGQAQGRRRFH